MSQLPNKYELKAYSEIPADKRAILYAGIAKEAKEKLGLKPPEDFGFFIESDNKVIAGLVGLMFFGEIYIDVLWVDPEFRNQKIGSHLVKKAEDLGRKKGCLFIAVNTFDFQALDFYRKLGFEEEFTRGGYLKNSVMYSLKKDLHD